MIHTSALILMTLIVQQFAGLNLRFALGQIESGDNDRAIGAAGEVSRYQILPSVWEEYETRTDYTSEPLAWSVAQRIIAKRAAEFARRVGRQPEAREIYALWNAPGKFRKADYRMHMLTYAIQERCDRFANLCATRP